MAGINGKGRLMAEINVTPLVDVMLVLLIIFMVTAPMMVQGLDVALPQTSAGAIPTESDNLYITIDRNQQIFIGDYKVELNSFEEKLKRIVEGHSGQRVYLRADKNVQYGIVVEVVSHIKVAGVEKLGMITEPLDEAADKPKGKRNHT